MSGFRGHTDTSGIFHGRITRPDPYRIVSLALRLTPVVGAGVGAVVTGVLGRPVLAIGLVVLSGLLADLFLSKRA